MCVCIHFHLNVKYTYYSVFGAQLMMMKSYLLVVLGCGPARVRAEDDPVWWCPTENNTLSSDPYTGLYIM